MNGDTEDNDRTHPPRSLSSTPWPRRKIANRSNETIAWDTFAGIGMDSGDANRFSQYEKMFGNAGLEKTALHQAPGMPQQAMVSEK